MSLELGIIADDFTGGAMVASLLEREGVETPVVTSAQAIADLPGHVEAVVFAGTYRLAPPEQARSVVRSVAEAMRVRGCPRVFSKYSATFDSTDRGNIGPVAEELCEVMGAEATVFASGFPESWITVFHGKLFVLDDLLSESFKQFDPVTPMTESDLVAVLRAQTTWAVGSLGHATFLEGADATRQHLEGRIAKGERFFIADAVDDHDIETCARAVSDWPVVTGADALPPALARAIGLSTAPARRDRHAHRRTPGREVVLAGSCAGMTLHQLDVFAVDHPVHRIDVGAVESIEGAAGAAADWAAQQDPLGAVAIATSAPADDLAGVQSALGVDVAAEVATAVIARTSALLRERGFRNVIVAGGETTGAVLGALGVDRFEVTAFDDLGGGLCAAETPEPMTILCKAGAMGGPDFFARGFERMRAGEETT